MRTPSVRSLLAGSAPSLSTASGETAALTRSGRPPTIAFNARQDPIFGEDTTPPLDTDPSTVGVCVTGDVTHALRAVGADASEDGTGRGTPIVSHQWRVRRLLPVECERLMGMPDGYTAIPGAKDSPRYAAVGNSMAVTVMQWLGERIEKVDAILRGGT